MIGKFGPAALAIISFILLCIACAGNNWLEVSSGSNEISQGLWKRCVTTSAINKCESRDAPSYIKTVRALTILSILVSVLAFLGCIASLFIHSDTVKVMGNPYVVGGILLIAGSFMSGGARVYQNNITIDTLMVFDYGWTFYMAYGSAGFCFISTIVLTVAYRYCRCCDDAYESI